MRSRTREPKLAPGRCLGGYRIEASLGAGGMGEVFRAVRESDGATVALKVLKRELVGSAQSARRFLHEARAAGEVHHKHLVGVLDVGEHDGTAYLVMRYVDGGTLEQRIEAHGQLGIDAVNLVVAQVGAGLDALHAHDLVHRDVKASNILFERSGSAVLTDFGLAKGEGYSALTSPGQIVGTLDYLAPELIRGEPASSSSDIYALGCVVFECLAGRPPFAGRGIFEVGMAHLDEPPADPCALRDDARPGYGATTLLALAKDPASRPRTATAYGHLLRLAAEGVAG